jgi:hypothetical protein
MRIGNKEVNMWSMGGMAILGFGLGVLFGLFYFRVPIEVPRGVIALITGTGGLIAGIGIDWQDTIETSS